MNDKRAPVLTLAVVFFLLSWVVLFFNARSNSTEAVMLGVAIVMGTFFVFGAILCIDFGIRPVTFLYTLVIGFCMQNVFLGLVVGDDLTRFHGQVLIGLKSAYVVGLLLTAMAMRVWQRSSLLPFMGADWIGVALIMYVSMAFVVSDYPLMSRITNVRNFVIPVIAFAGVRFLDVDREDLRGLVRFLLNFAVVLAVIGVLERFVFDDDALFELVNLAKVTNAKIGLEIIPGTLWTSLGDVRDVRRLVSVFYEPINAGYFFASVTLVAIAFRRWAYAAFLGVIAFLTFAKGAWALVAAGLCVLVIERFRSKFARTVLYSLMVVGYLGGLYLTAVVFISSTRAHLIGLASGLLTAIRSPFGEGVGSGGYFSWMYGVHANPWTARNFGGDSGIGSIGQQLGMVGIILYLGWVVAVVRKLGVIHRQCVGDPHCARMQREVSLLALALMVGLLFNVFVQENALSIYANYLIVIFAAVAMTMGAGTYADGGRRGVANGEG